MKEIIEKRIISKFSVHYAQQVARGNKKCPRVQTVA